MNFTLTDATFSSFFSQFSAGNILRFVKSVRVIQIAYRAFLAIKKKHIAGLMKVWESYESKHISVSRALQHLNDS